MEYSTLFDKFVDRALDKERSIMFSWSSVFIVDEDLKLVSVNNKEVFADRNRRVGPGDLLCCVNAAKGTAGCGTHEKCADCVLCKSVKQAFSTNTLVMDEFTLVQTDETKLTLEYTITPFDMCGKKYAVVFAIDISARKQKQIMDRVFFHDVLNLMGALNGFVQLLLEEPDHELLMEVKKLSEQVINNISYQKDVMNAENKSLALLPTDVTVKSFLDDVSVSLCSTAQNFNSKLEINDNCGMDVVLHTDVRLLHRVILNMVKNAVEASANDATVTVTASMAETGKAVVFSVHNDGVIPQQYRSRIFRFGQSSKGIGRGLGTYSMKLFGENYLKGRVWFTTDEQEGTTFFLNLPLDLNQ